MDASDDVLRNIHLFNLNLMYYTIKLFTFTQISDSSAFKYKNFTNNQVINL